MDPNLSAIAELQRHALRRPFRLGQGPPPMELMRLPCPSGRVFDGLLTVDVDWPYGPAWHLMLSLEPLDVGIPGSPITDEFDLADDLELRHLFDAIIGNVGCEEAECYRSIDGVTYHGICLLTKAELREIGVRR